MTAIQNALAGMQDAESRLDTTASHIARIPFANSAQDTVDLSSEMVNLLEARTNFEANTKVVHVANEVQQSTLSILA